MLSPAIFMSSRQPIIQLSYVAILSIYTPMFHIYEIDNNDVDNKENTKEKNQHLVVRYYCKHGYSSVMSDYLSHLSRFDSKLFEQYSSNLVLPF